MSKPEILQVGPYPAWDEGPLSEAFVVHRYFEAPDKAAFLARHGDGVRGIATRGELGADAAMIAALPGWRSSRSTASAMTRSISRRPAPAASGSPTRPTC